MSEKKRNVGNCHREREDPRKKGERKLKEERR